MRRKVDEPNLLSVLLRDLRVPAETLSQRIGKAHEPVADETGQHLPGERLGDRADPHECLAVGRLVCLRAHLAETSHRRFPVSDRADDQTRHLRFQKEHRAGEVDCFLEQLVLRVRPQRKHSEAQDQDGREDRHLRWGQASATASHRDYAPSISKGVSGYNREGVLHSEFKLRDKPRGRGRRRAMRGRGR
jgi:hypothetical protein